MRRIGLILLGMAMCLPVAAQKSVVWRDSFNAGVNYSLNVGEADIDYNGVAINAGYRKFLYWGLFVMPEVSLYWQQYKYEYTAVYDYAPYPPGSGIETPPHQNYSERRKESLDRFGIGADALVGIRVSIVEKVGIDLMAGPYIGWSFANNVDGFDGEFDNFEVRGRFGVGVSVLDKVYVNAFYDVGKKKFIKEGNWNYNNRGNIVTVGVGYTF